MRVSNTRWTEVRWAILGFLKAESLCCISNPISDLVISPMSHLLSCWNPLETRRLELHVISTGKNIREYNPEQLVVNPRTFHVVDEQTKEQGKGQDTLKAVPCL